MSSASRYSTRSKALVSDAVHAATHAAIAPRTRGVRGGVRGGRGGGRGGRSCTQSMEGQYMLTMFCNIYIYGEILILLLLYTDIVYHPSPKDGVTIDADASGLIDAIDGIAASIATLPPVAVASAPAAASPAASIATLPPFTVASTTTAAAPPTASIATSPPVTVASTTTAAAPPTAFITALPLADTESSDESDVWEEEVEEKEEVETAHQRSPSIATSESSSGEEVEEGGVDKQQPAISDVYESDNSYATTGRSSTGSSRAATPTIEKEVHSNCGHKREHDDEEEQSDSRRKQSREEEEDEEEEEEEEEEEIHATRGDSNSGHKQEHDEEEEEEEIHATRNDSNSSDSDSDSDTAKPPAAIADITVCFTPDKLASIYDGAIPPEPLGQHKIGLNGRESFFNEKGTPTERQFIRHVFKCLAKKYGGILSVFFAYYTHARNMVAHLRQIRDSGKKKKGGNGATANTATGHSKSRKIQPNPDGALYTAERRARYASSGHDFPNQPLPMPTTKGNSHFIPTSQDFASAGELLAYLLRLLQETDASEDEHAAMTEKLNIVATYYNQLIQSFDRTAERMVETRAKRSKYTAMRNRAKKTREAEQAEEAEKLKAAKRKAADEDGSDDDDDDDDDDDGDDPASRFPADIVEMATAILERQYASTSSVDIGPSGRKKLLAVFCESIQKDRRKKKSANRKRVNPAISQVQLHEQGAAAEAADEQ